MDTIRKLHTDFPEPRKDIDHLDILYDPFIEVFVPFEIDYIEDYNYIFKPVYGEDRNEQVFRIYRIYWHYEESPHDIRSFDCLFSSTIYYNKVVPYLREEFGIDKDEL